MNKLEHLLTCVTEECSEVAKEACKALRFGIDDLDPTNGKEAGVKLVEEYIQLTALMTMLDQGGYIKLPSKEGQELLIEAKQQRVYEYMNYASKRGHLT